MNHTQIQSLLNPSVYPEPTTAVHLLQTHVSLIFVTDRFVYKIKKPVNLGFLDFTTLDRRLFFCREELRLNRRLAPEIYLDVVPVRATPRGVSFRGNGAPSRLRCQDGPAPGRADDEPASGTGSGHRQTRFAPSPGSSAGFIWPHPPARRSPGTAPLRQSAPTGRRTSASWNSSSGGP